MVMPMIHQTAKDLSVQIYAVCKLWTIVRT